MFCKVYPLSLSESWQTWTFFFKGATSEKLWFQWDKMIQVKNTSCIVEHFYFIVVRFCLLPAEASGAIFLKMASRSLLLR